jgi:hypothetical protein
MYQYIDTISQKSALMPILPCLLKMAQHRKMTYKKKVPLGGKNVRKIVNFAVVCMI